MLWLNKHLPCLMQILRESFVDVHISLCNQAHDLCVEHRVHVFDLHLKRIWELTLLSFLNDECHHSIQHHVLKSLMVHIQTSQSILCQELSVL